MIFVRALPSRLLRARRMLAVCFGLGATLTAFAQGDFGSSGGSSTPVFRPVPVYFPPNPPPLGRLVSKLTVQSNLPGLRSAPEELAAHINEPFYAPLSTHLSERRLSAKLRQRLDAYGIERTALLDELRATVDRTRGDEPAARRTAFATLAHQQAVRLVQLEATAEQLRSDLVTSEFDWSALREWRLGGRNTRGDSPNEIAAVLRAYSFYQAGLAPTQRRLLREITLEVVSGSEDGTAAAAAQQFLFFSPELARVKLPATIPAAVAAQVAAFETQRSDLKKELFDAVIAQEQATFAFSRTGAFKALAEKQAAGLAALDRLADEIRDGLAAVPEMAAETPRSPLPPQLTQRTVAVLEGRAALVRDSRSRIERVLARVPADHPVSFPYALDNEGIRVRPVARRGRGGGGPGATDALSVGILAELKQVGDEHKARSEELSREVDSLRADVGRHLGGKPTPLAIDQAIDGVVRYHVALENEGAYGEYRIAALEPGLSPPQRRLLFAGAVQRLELPLPRAEMQPTRRPAGW